LPEHVAVNERDVLFRVSIVPERDDPKVSEAGGEIGDGHDLHAHPVNAEALAVMVPIAVDQIVQPWNRGQGLGAGYRAHSVRSYRDGRGNGNSGHLAAFFPIPSHRILVIDFNRLRDSLVMSISGVVI
jgi:hypothetical protein